MTNETITAILGYFLHEAKHSAQSAQKCAERLHTVAMDDVERADVTLGAVSADRLLRAVDDMRSLLSSDPVLAGGTDNFDLALCAVEIVDVLNLASGKRALRVATEGAPGVVLITQYRRAFEELLTRVLDTAGKMLEAGEVWINLRAFDGQNCARLTISFGDANLAGRLADWLNADPDRVQFEDPADVPFAVGVMLAGRCLRALGGSAEVTRDPCGGGAITLDVPSEAPGPGRGWNHEARPDALAVLIAEDDDESFALTEMELQAERVWRAHDGPQALRMIQKQRFDVVFMDVHMPGMDGYQVIRRMREWEMQTGNARTPIVVLSADDPATQRRSAAECGCSGFLGKPLCRRDATPLLDRLKQTRQFTALSAPPTNEAPQ